MVFDLSKLINPSYLLDTSPPYAFAGFWAFASVFVTCLFMALFLQFTSVRPGQLPLRRRLTVPLYVTAFGGLALLFFRNQSVDFLSMRLLLFVFTLASLLVIGYSLTVARREIAVEQEKHHQRQRFEKYLPKPKR